MGWDTGMTCRDEGWVFPSKEMFVFTRRRDKYKIIQITINDRKVMERKPKE